MRPHPTSVETMRQLLWLAGIFLAAFLITFLLILDRDGFKSTGPPLPYDSRTEAPSTHAETTQPFAGQRSAADYPVSVDGELPGNSHDDEAGGNPKAPGSILGTVKTEGGWIGVVGIRLMPDGGRLTENQDGAFRVVDVPPGTYRAFIWADGFVAKTVPEFAVRPGRATRLELDLIPGIVPKGRVTATNTSSPIAGALVQFEGHAQACTDANGVFEVPFTVPHSALDFITLSHPDFDQVTFIKHAVSNPANIALSMSRGSIRVRGRVTLANEIELPALARVSLSLDRGSGKLELRRSTYCNEGGEFKFEGIRDGVYVIGVEFPGSKLQEQRRPAVINGPEEEIIDIEIGGGSFLEGKLFARAWKPAGSKVELLDEKGLSVLAVTSDSEGFFKFEGVEPGQYRLKVWLGSSWFNTEILEIGHEKFRLIEVDCDFRRINS